MHGAKLKFDKVFKGLVNRFFKLLKPLGSLRAKVISKKVDMFVPK